MIWIDVTTDHIGDANSFGFAERIVAHWSAAIWIDACDHENALRQDRGNVNLDHEAFIIPIVTNEPEHIRHSYGSTR